MRSGCSILLLALCASANAVAEDKLWSFYTGLNYRESDFSLPGNKSNSDSWTTTLGLAGQVGEAAWLGGWVSYMDSDTKYRTLDGKGNLDSTGGGLYYTRALAPGLYATGTLGYGKSQIDNRFSTGGVDTDADYKSASIGLTQYIPLSERLMSSLTLRYSYLSNNIDGYLVSGGQQMESDRTSLSYVGLGGRLDYKINNWTPYVRLERLEASQEFVPGAGDDDYYNYALGIVYALTAEAALDLYFDSAFDNKYADYDNVGVNLSWQF